MEPMALTKWLVLLIDIESVLTLVSKFVPDANLFAAAPKTRKHKAVDHEPKARPYPNLQRLSPRGKGKRLRVRWYGGGWRNVEVVTGKGHWYKSGKGVVHVLWVFVRDLDGTHRDEYFFTTDMSMSAKAVIEMYGGRWNIETTFQEMREHLGLETTRGWSQSDRSANGTLSVLLVHTGCRLLRYDVLVKSTRTSQALDRQRRIQRFQI